MRLAVVFPGQGSQSVGMGRDWHEHCTPSREVYDAGDSRLGFELSQLCFEGPEEELRLTANTQPAILATSVAVWNAVREELPPPAMFAGHSLGEYTALVAAEALALGDALELVRERGRLMQEAVPVGQGAMSAVIGLDALQIAAICASVETSTGENVQVANYNSPEQTVITGASEAVRLAGERCSAAGAKRVVELTVSAPFHSRLMREAADKLLSKLRQTEFHPVSTPVLANLNAEPYPADAAAYPELLAKQMYSSVLWAQTVRRMAEDGITHLLEVGPGKVLRMLAAKIAPEIKAANLEKYEQVEEVKAWLGESG